MIRLLSILLLVITFSSSSAIANSKRSKTLNFEDDLIEGINRKPLDSVSQISDPTRDDQDHLYQKRSGFQDRNQILRKEMRLFQ